MNDLTLNKKEIDLLNKLTEFKSVEIIWDINAFYFNTDIKTYKLECFDEKPIGSEFMYDEIFYCRFLDLNKRIIFEENRPDFWYKIISVDCKIIEIKYLNVIEKFPDNKLLPIDSVDNNATRFNKSTLGLIIETDKGYIPAFILPSNHGFSWQSKYDFYSKSEIEKLIAENITHYEIK